MEVLTNSTTLFISKVNSFSSNSKSQRTQSHFVRQPITILKFPISRHKNNPFNLSSPSSSSSSSSSSSCFATFSSTETQTSTSTSSVSLSSTTSSLKRHWMVLMEAPEQGVGSREAVLDYYVNTLETVLGSEKEAQMCLYDASFETHFGFCGDIDEQASLELSRLPGVLWVKPDPDFTSVKKNYDPTNVRSEYQSSQDIRERFLFPKGSTKPWLVRMDKPGIGVVTKAQMVDYYAQILAKVLGNEKDAQMCIYHVSWQSSFGFCCEVDEECAEELAGVPGVSSVVPDENFGSEHKDYEGSSQITDSSEEIETSPIKTRKLFVTGLSFYTSEKTLRAAFEGFGELTEVRIIMDKISKRSKGYAFIEYSTEEAAGEALREMNGKIINGWMIVVDAAKPKASPPKNGRGRIVQR